jgi:hypothetical protein
VEIATAEDDGFQEFCCRGEDAPESEIGRERP